jgi:hypothetical protein
MINNSTATIVLEYNVEIIYTNILQILEGEKKGNGS